MFDHFWDDFSMICASLFRDIVWCIILHSALFADDDFLDRFPINFGTIFASMFHQFSWLFRHRFSHRFVHWFLMENGSQMEPKSTWGGELFGTLFATFSFMLILCWFYVEFGSPWAPFWCPLAPFGLPLAHFWLTFGALWLTFGALGSLLAILALDFLAFGAP